MAAHAFLTDREYEIVAAACERLLPGGEGPSATDVGAAEYIDRLLGAFSFEPPRIWAGGPFSGRHGGEPGFETFIAPTPIEELAWRTRLEGSQGRPEREHAGPVVGWQELYRAGIAELGDDFAGAGADEQERRLREAKAFTRLLFGHACEAMYGDPVYGGNRGGAAWAAIDFEGDVQPRGYTDEEVSGP